jgi:hypothetical protein
MKQATKTIKKKSGPIPAKGNKRLPIRSRPKKIRRSADPLFSDWSTFRDSGPSDLAQNHDKYLTDILVEEHERGQRR